MKYTKNPDKIKQLSPIQYEITQKNGTERPGTGKYLHNTAEGLYVDVVSGEPLFYSTEKYDAGCGWPSFTTSIFQDNIKELRDTSGGMIRTEVRSTHGDSHLGHVFPDGPKKTGGLRYCINSAALRFIPKAELAAAGYGHLFNKQAIEKTILAGGCFWGMQELIRKQAGVLATRVGYTGGEVANATYRNHGNHAEAIEIEFDPTLTSFRAILEFFFQIHDPTTLDRQGNDRGPSYRSEIFYTSETQQLTALEIIAAFNASKIWPGPIVTKVSPAAEFWLAEPEHQDYLQRTPNGYTCHFIRHEWRLP